MKIRLKEAHKAALDDIGKVELSGGCSLSLYKSASPINSIEVQMGTTEGRRLMALHESRQDKVIAAITERQLGDNYLENDIVISPISVFNSRAEAIAALTTTGIDVGFMPLLRLSTKMSGNTSPIEFIPG